MSISTAIDRNLSIICLEGIRSKTPRNQIDDALIEYKRVLLDGGLAHSFDYGWSNEALMWVNYVAVDDPTFTRSLVYGYAYLADVDDKVNVSDAYDRAMRGI